MCILEEFIGNLYEFLTGMKYTDSSIIRKHSRKLNELGDISFPLSINNWYHLFDNKTASKSFHTILDYQMFQCETDIQLEQLQEESKKWDIKIGQIIVKGNDVNIFISRSPYIFNAGINKALTKESLYGSSQLITKKLSVGLDCDLKGENYGEIDLSTLRLLILRDVTLRLLEFTTDNQTDKDDSSVVTFTLSSMKQGQGMILCGPVVNTKNIKDNTTKARELLFKRASDMRMMAQHKYGVQTQLNTSWKTYFEKLGKAAVIIEMMSNKPHKALKLTMHDLQTAHKGCSFIFYNCARIAILFKEHQKRIEKKVYPELPPLEEIDFSLLTQPEEWELFYVYILQFPTTIKNCIRDIDKGIINPQYLVSFLSNLCSIFSTYYRRVRILTDPREHLFAILHARIYLLKSLQCVFHNALYLLNIEPVKEM